MRVIFLGDVVGKAGRLGVKRELPGLRSRFAPDIIIANAENIAGGIGMTCETLDELLAAGVDLVTSGNHVWRHREMLGRMEKDRRIVRPANYPGDAPGRGWVLHRLEDGRSLALLNILGTTFMEPLPCPFRTAGQWLEEIEAMENAPAIRLVDFHAEATSEKKTMGYFLDGKVSALVGTHTHVQTADASILPHGTGYITDLGMCGVEHSSLGADFDSVLKRYITRMPSPYKPAKGSITVNGVFLDIDDTCGKARDILLVRTGRSDSLDEKSLGE